MILLLGLDKDRCVICLQNGKRLPSNTHALLEYANENKLDLFAIGVRSYSENVRSLISTFNDLPIVQFKTLRGLIHLLRSKILIISHGAFDYFPYQKQKGQIIINIWHGLPLKKIGNNTKADWDYMITSSAADERIMEERFFLKKDQLVKLGMPKMDKLFQTKRDIRTNNLILYVPTFRRNSNTIIFPFEDRDLEKLNTFLQERDLVVGIKLHINDIHLKEALNLSLYTNIEVLSMDVDLEEKILDARIMVTDYSGIIYDGAAVDLPMIFVPYDYNEYEAETGFLYDYFDFIPGPIVNNQEEFLSVLKRELNPEIDEFKSAREDLKKKYFYHQDSNSCKRICDFTTKLLSES